MRNFLALALLTVASAPLFAVSMNFGGSLRSQAALYDKLDLGTGSTQSTKSFIETRALLEPNLVVDDHFSVHSQWNLLNSSQLAPDATKSLGLTAGQGGWILGDPAAAKLTLTRAWLEWTSDFGVFRVGRMPISWGYGLVYDAGDELWDNWASNLDRAEYRLHLGHVIGALAYSKPRKLSTIGQTNDQDFYTVYLQYDNPEMEMQAGVMYEKQVRSTASAAEITGQSTPTGVPNANPWYVPSSNAPPLSSFTFYPLSSNLVDLYVKKTAGALSYGGEVSWLTGSAAPTGDLNALALSANASYDFSKVKAYLDVLYASGDAAPGSHMNGFVILHRNRSPGLILGRELLGAYSSSATGQGSMLYYGDAGTFSGLLYFRPGMRIDWSTAWTTGLEVLIPRKAVTSASDKAALGVEVDLNVTHQVYKNFNIGLDLGYLFPGDGLRVPNAKGVFATRGTLALKF